MKYFGNGLSESHKELNKLLHKKDCLEEAKSKFLDLHSKLHLSIISDGKKNEVDRLLNDLSDEEYAIMPTNKDETIAWAIWHIARIEDLTMNILVNNTNQVFDNDWKKRLNVNITDTGNALSDEEIMNLSKNINIKELLNYRNAVGKRTREIIIELTEKDIMKNVSQERLDRILKEGGVTTQDESIWLLDFWGKKNIVGILLMPPTRHMILHLNDCCKWKEQIGTKQKFFLK